RGGPVPGGVGVRRAPGRRWPRRTPGAGRARRSARRPGRRSGRHAVRPWWVSSSWGSRCPCRWRCRGWSVRRGDARRARRWALTSEQRPFLGGGLTLALLVVQTLGDLFGVTLVVQLQEAVDDLALRGRAYGVPGLAAHLVEPVVEPAVLLDPVLPAVGADGGLVDVAVNGAELDDVGVVVGRVEDQVVGLGEPGLTGEHHVAAVGVETVTEVPEFLGEGGHGEGLEDVRGGIVDACFKS